MRRISVADYFVEFLIANGVTDVFGYQGGMIAYIFDSLGKYKDQIRYHSCGSEQGAAFAACSFSQASGKIGVAISTSGPGFTNLVTGIANAWFDSIPVLFVSGNVNTKDKTREHTYRQNGFQEIQAAKIAAPIVKDSIELELGMDYKKVFDDALNLAMSDRKGPVYIDFPINICREEVDVDTVAPCDFSITSCANETINGYFNELVRSKRPVIIAGAGLIQAHCKDKFRQLIEKIKVPVVTTMPAIDLLPSDSPYMMGYIGGTGRREPGIVLQNADYVISIGTRLCSKQVGHNMSLFAPKATRFVRIDIDKSEFERRLKDDEIEISANISDFMDGLLDSVDVAGDSHSAWAEKCLQIKTILSDCDNTIGNLFFRNISSYIPEDASVILDVGKNLNYGTQSLVVKDKTQVYMSAGLGSMGYSIPAAIGVAYGNDKPVFAFMGDGGAQMNIQELNTIAKNNLPIKLFVLNNKALGNILIFQENYLGSRFVATKQSENDYFSCDFVKVAEAYGIAAHRIHEVSDLSDYADELTNDKPVLFEYEYDDCPAMPGIVAGGAYLDSGSGLDDNVIESIKSLLSDEV